MTTIVGDWRRKCFVTDSQTSFGDFKNLRSTKVYSVPGGLIAGAGRAADIEKAILWLRGEAPKPKTKTVPDFLLMTQNGLFLMGTGGYDEWMLVPEFETLGTGAAAASAMLAMGHTAEEAVQAACMVDIYSGGAVQTHYLPKGCKIEKSRR